jgi:hypothetical protein
MPISAAMGHSRLDMTSPIDSLTPILCRSAVERLRLFLTVKILFDLFVLAGLYFGGQKFGVYRG